MALQSSGSISMSQINAEFGRGNDLNSYRGTTWYTDAGGSGTFSTGAISYTDFYGKRVSSPAPSSIDVLVVAGGGAWGDTLLYNQSPGGGGAGGMCEHWGRSITTGTTYTVVIGAGGTWGQNYQGSNGSNSTFDSITSIGGGSGGSPFNYIIPQAGGSGGGGQYGGLAANSYIGGARLQYDSGGATGYGSPGQNSTSSPISYNEGAGGGAGGYGTGRANSITGELVTYAKGGVRLSDTNVTLTRANPNTGDGSNVVIATNPEGPRGGSGVVIIRYPNTYPTATVTGSPIYTNTGGYHIYKFTGSGTIRW